MYPQSYRVGSLFPPGRISLGSNKKDVQVFRKDQDKSQFASLQAAKAGAPNIETSPLLLSASLIRDYSTTHTQMGWESARHKFRYSP